MSRLKKTPLTNAEKCKRRRLKLATEDPERWKREKERNKIRAEKSRQKPKTQEEQDKLREQARIRQKRYMEKKKAEKAACIAQGIPSPRKTRQDAEKEAERREANRNAVRKHRSLQSAQKKRRVREKRKAYYYAKKAEREAALQKKNTKATQMESDCPYPTVDAFKRAVQRVKEKIRARGVKLAFLCKGMLKSADKAAKQKLKDLHVSFTTPEKKTPSPRKTLAAHMDRIKKKRDAASLSHKRALAQAFVEIGSSSYTEIGLRRKLVKSKGGRIYERRQENPHGQLVRNFYIAHSHPDPGKNSTKRQLLKPVKELHRDFKRKHPGAKVSSRTFHRMRPSNVAGVKKAKFRQCLCEVCLNPKLKLHTINRFLKKKVECVRDLLIESVCAFDNMPALRCVQRKCVCGTQTVKERFVNELHPNLHQKVKWVRWEHVKEGKTSRMDKVKKRGTLQTCIDELFSELHPLYEHVYTADWQRNQLHDLKVNLPRGWALVTCDFAENFLCKFQDEPQSAHWAYKQVTLFPAVAFYKCPSEGCSDLRRDEIAFFSDDLLKDAHLTQACVDRVVKKLSQCMGTDLKKVIIASDGCAAQFKSKLPFLLFSKMRVSGVKVEKVFYGSRHGKNDSDWSGGAIKRSVTRALATGTVCVRNARDMYEHCVSTLSVPEVLDGCQHTEGCQHKTRQFVYLHASDVKRDISSSSVKTVAGSRKMHHVRSLGPGLLATRDLCCFCLACTSEQYEECSSVDVPAWKIVQINHSTHAADPQESESDEELEIDTSAHSEFDSDTDSSQTESAIVDSEVTEGSFESSDDEVNLDEGMVEDSSEEAMFGSHVGEGAGDAPDSAGVSAGERQQFFKHLQISLAACTSYAELKQKSLDLKETLVEFSLPDHQPSFDAAPSDIRASNLLPEEVRGKCRPLAVKEDGNCFFRSLSLLLFGDEENHVELRVRTVMAMCTEEELFLDGSNWCTAHEDFTPEQVVHVAVLTSASPQRTPQASFQQEALSVIKDGAYAGLWQFFVAATVLNRPIHSIFPPLGWPVYQKHCNRIVRRPGCCTDSKLPVMWTSSRDDMEAEHWLPNHFVPVVFDSDNHVRREFPSIGSTYLLRWGGSSYPCQVLETDRLLDLVCVHFMSKSRSGYWCWSEADFSWEPLTSVVKEISLQLVEQVSTHRCQFFSFS